MSREHFGFDEPRTVALLDAVGAVSADRAIGVVTQPTMAAVGGLLLWARKENLALVAVVAERDADSIERWLAGFEARPGVHRLEGRDLVEPDPTDARREPGPLPSIPPLFEAADVDVIVEHGDVLAEVRGLEVARVVVDPEGVERIEVGVGRYDRAAHRVMTTDQPLGETLAEVVERVDVIRRRAAPSHLYNRLSRARWLRGALVADPEPLGLTDLRPVDPLPPRRTLLENGPAPALGTDSGGAQVLVLASSGIDPGLAVATSAVAQREDPDRVVIALPPRDRLDAMSALLERLRWPLETVAVDPPWG